MSDYCEGCLSLIQSKYDSYCSYSKYNDSGECPCCTCIVKVMCNDLCEKFCTFSKIKLGKEIPHVQMHTTIWAGR